MRRWASRGEHRRICLQIGVGLPEAWDGCACGAEKPTTLRRCAACARLHAIAAGVTFREAATGNAHRGLTLHWTHERGTPACGQRGLLVAVTRDERETTCRHCRRAWTRITGAAWRKRG